MTHFIIFEKYFYYSLFEINKTLRGYMTELNKDIFISGLFLAGIFGFVSGAYVMSSVLFVTIAVINYVYDNFKQTVEI